MELEGEIEVGVSVGGTIYDDQHDRDGLARRDGSAVETALRQADMAMYRAKTEGRGMYRFFDAAMDARLQERVQLEREIKGAIARGEIVPYYQPLVDLNTQTTIGYELLARWEHPTRGLLLPEIFIPIAEDTNSIADLTYSVLSRAVRDAKDRPQDTFLSLNLSPRQFADPWLSQKILAILTEAGFPAKRLEIEITETAVVQRLDEAKVTLKSLRNLGIRIALDDFGPAIRACTICASSVSTRSRSTVPSSWKCWTSRKRPRLSKPSWGLAILSGCRRPPRESRPRRCSTS